MTKVIHGLFCSQVKRKPGIMGQPSDIEIVRPFDAFPLPFLPTLFTFVFVCELIEVDLTAQHNLRFQFLSPEGLVLSDTMDISLPSGGPEASTTYTFKIDVEFRNVLLKKEGFYKIRALFDGSELQDTCSIEAKEDHA